MNQSINTDSKNSKEPQQKYRLGTVSIKILGGLDVGNIVPPFAKKKEKKKGTRVQSQSHVTHSSNTKVTIAISQVNRGSYSEPWLSLKSGH